MGERNLYRRATRSSADAGLEFTRHTESEERDLATEGTET
jgi:hypothetical protein